MLTTYRKEGCSEKAGLLVRDYRRLARVRALGWDIELIELPGGAPLLLYRAISWRGRGAGARTRLALGPGDPNFVHALEDLLRLDVSRGVCLVSLVQEEPIFLYGYGAAEHISESHGRTRALWGQLTGTPSEGEVRSVQAD